MLRFSRTLLALALLCCMVVMLSGQTTVAPQPGSDKRPYQLQLIEKNRQTPISQCVVAVSLVVDGSTITRVNLNSDARGVIDLTDFFHSHDAQLKKYKDRVVASLWVEEKSVKLSVDALEKQGPQRVEVDLGPVLVMGSFADESGKRVTSFKELFPAEVRDYLDKNKNFWSGQIRVYESTGTTPGEGLVVNQLRADETGQFHVYVQKNRAYRIELTGSQDLALPTLTFVVAENDLEIKLVAKPKPYCVYGAFLNASDGKPVTENIAVNGLEIYFNGMGQSRYALFFDKPGAYELKIGCYAFQKKYREQSATVKVSEPLQQQDFKLEPFADKPSAVKFHLKITGITISKSYDVSACLTDENNFCQTGEFDGKDAYDFVLPQAGRYQLNLYSQRYDVQAENQLLIDKEQTLESKAVEKDTWVTVQITGVEGKSIGFPKLEHLMHQPRVNCVILDEESTKDGKPKQPGRYLDGGPADVGGGLRPDENGQVKFLLAKGGKYVLHTRFNKFQDSVTPIEIKLHESKIFDLKIKRIP